MAVFAKIPNASLTATTSTRTANAPGAVNITMALPLTPVGISAAHG
jgi:hypothetical protein